MTKIFVSYSWKQGSRVWDRLVPVLRAGGIEVLIDRERFVAGKDVLGQMNKMQEQADRHVRRGSPASSTTAGSRSTPTRSSVQ